jgi:Ca2+ transporting ATPase
MVTGDNKITARAIAYSVGIINSSNETRALVLEGPEFLRKIGGVICDNCKELPKCDCVKNQYELNKPENKGKKI